MEKPFSDFRKILDTAFRNSVPHLENLDQAPVGATRDLATLRAQLTKPLTNEGLPANQVIEELTRDVTGGLLVLRWRA